MFDVWTGRRNVRDALRQLIKRLGFVQLQKSIWVYPYDCRDEVIFIRSYFRLPESACRLVVSEDLGNDEFLRKHFRL